MNLRYRIYTSLFILSFINCLYKDDYFGAIISLAFIPLCFMVGSRLNTKCVNHVETWEEGYGLTKLGTGSYEYNQCSKCGKPLGKMRNFVRDVE